MALMRWTLKDLIDVIEGSVLNKFDFILFIEGKRGLGKSTLGYKIATRLKSRGVLKFNPVSDMVFSRDDTLRLLATMIRHVILSDELINVAYNRDFFEQDQKKLLKGLNMYRDSENVFLGCIPSFGDLDTQIKRLCKIRITVIKRGVALIHVPIRGIFLPDPWDTQENIKREMKKRKGYGKLSTVKGILHFSDLTPEQRIKYEELKKDKRGHVFRDQQDMDIIDPDRSFFDKVYKLIISGHLTKEGLDSVCRVQGKTISSFRDRLNKRLREDADQSKTLQSFLDEAEEKKSSSQSGSSVKPNSEPLKDSPTFRVPRILKTK